MLLQEFIVRTGYTPKSAEEYRQIESQYYDFPGDKDEFCKMWKRKWLPILVEGALHEFETEAETEQYVLHLIEKNQVFRTVGRRAVMVW